MAMNGNALGTAIKTELDGLSSGDRENMEKCFQAIGRAIVAHIQGSAAVSTANVAGGSDTRPGTIT